MTVIIDFTEKAGLAQQQNSTLARVQRANAAIAELAVNAKALQAQMEDMFGEKMKIEPLEEKTSTRYRVSFSDRVKIYSETSGFEFIITQTKDSLAEGIAAVYYSVTQQLGKDRTVRVREQAGDDDFKTLGYDERLGSLYDVDLRKTQIAAGQLSSNNVTTLPFKR